jgi:hypothetical protein
VQILPNHHILFVFWPLLAFVVGALTSDVSEGSVRRAFTCAGPVFEIIVAYAVYKVLSFYWSNRKVFWLLAFLMTFSLFLGVHQFLTHYFVYQPTSIEAEKVFMTPTKELFNYTESVKGQYDKILVTDRFDVTPSQVNSRLVLEDYVFFYTKNLLNNSKYVLGNVSPHPINGKTLFVVRDYELVNVTPLKVFSYSNGEVAYKSVA